MVKNIKGGSKHKKYAKSKEDISEKINLNNLIRDDQQLYGFISNNLGNCRFEIKCSVI